MPEDPAPQTRPPPWCASLELGSLCDAAPCPACCPVVRGTPGQDSPMGWACLGGPDGVPPARVAGSLLSPREDALSSCRLPTLLALLGHSRHCQKDANRLPVGKAATPAPPPPPPEEMSFPSPAPCLRSRSRSPVALNQPTSSHTPSPVSLSLLLQTLCPARLLPLTLPSQALSLASPLPRQPCRAPQASTQSHGFTVYTTREHVCAPVRVYMHVCSVCVYPSLHTYS